MSRDLTMSREGGGEFNIDRARHLDVTMQSGSHWHIVWSKGWGWVLLVVLLVVVYFSVVLGAALDQHGYIPTVR